MSSTDVRPARVTLRGVSRAFGTRTVLRDIDLDVTPGETVALVGASGSGKSTLLRLLAGLDRPSGGTVHIDERPVRGVDPRCAVVFQEPRLLTWRDLAGNVALGLPAGTARSEGRAAVRHWLEVVGLGGFERHRPRQVSGGMAQRTALARALVRRPGVLLLDEPFAALDALTRLRMQDLLTAVQRETGTTVVLVTHDVDEALTLADRIVVLAAGGTAAAVDDSGARIAASVGITAARPRDRADPELEALRLQLLDLLGVPRRGPAVAAEPHEEIVDEAPNPFRRNGRRSGGDVAVGLR
ncbi:Aliphatic sulfonates import ATP-binding protein SsuB [Nocardia sp. RB56]|uniref:Aliphatic sulfonates import ATP-binding protein SsuB n=1 Tax=Nocardia aurantia TaxID=2585199 RepID=A0A7K0E062_9NOCA|nr:ABC transporter ATP-binding protein [Nocardia aurantia]MQY31177.1 Aliphatic sulfonates import ATP-binding protein SsuB [Nocardia aurantia]